MFFLMISMFLLKNACTLIPKKKLPLQTFLRKLNRLATVRLLRCGDGAIALIINKINQLNKQKKL